MMSEGGGGGGVGGGGVPNDALDLAVRILGLEGVVVETEVLVELEREFFFKAPPPVIAVAAALSEACSSPGTVPKALCLAPPPPRFLMQPPIADWFVHTAVVVPSLHTWVLFDNDEDKISPFVLTADCFAVRLTSSEDLRGLARVPTLSAFSAPPLRFCPWCC